MNDEDGALGLITSNSFLFARRTLSNGPQNAFHSLRLKEAGFESWFADVIVLLKKKDIGRPPKEKKINDIFCNDRNENHFQTRAKFYMNIFDLRNLFCGCVCCLTCN